MALIGDMVGSRQLPDRAQVQARLEGTLGELNQALSDRVAAELLITTGDEFQGLFLDPAAALTAAIGVSDALHPIQLSLGMGAGTLSTPLKEQAVGMDGPCFHRARGALEAAEDEEAWMRVAGFGEPTERAVDTILELVGAIRAGWTERQAGFIAAHRELPTQRAVAEAFDVNPSVVSESLKAAKYHHVRRAEVTVATMLTRAFEDLRAPEGEA